MRIEGLAALPPSKVTPGWMGLVETVARHEPCWSLEELNVRGRRYQIIVVNRADHLTACYRDFGTALTREFAWLCGFDHSVGEAMDWAEEQRDDDYWDKFLVEKEQTSTLVTDFREQAEKDVYIVKNRSTFGPGGKVQRNGYSRRGR